MAKTTPFTVPDIEVPRAKGPTIKKLANGTAVLVRRSTDDEWEPGKIVGQGYNQGKVVDGYEVLFEREQAVHTVAFTLLGTHIKPKG